MEAMQHPPEKSVGWSILSTVIKADRPDLDQGLGRDRKAGVIWTVRLAARPGDGELMTSGS